MFSRLFKTTWPNNNPKGVNQYAGGGGGGDSAQSLIDSAYEEFGHGYTESAGGTRYVQGRAKNAADLKQVKEFMGKKLEAAGFKPDKTQSAAANADVYVSDTHKAVLRSQKDGDGIKVTFAIQVLTKKADTMFAELFKTTWPYNNPKGINQYTQSAFEQAGGAAGGEKARATLDQGMNPKSLAEEKAFFEKERAKVAGTKAVDTVADAIGSVFDGTGKEGFLSSVRPSRDGKSASWSLEDDPDMPHYQDEIKEVLTGSFGFKQQSESKYVGKDGTEVDFKDLRGDKFEVRVKLPFEIQGPKNKLPKDVAPEKKKVMQEYMNGFHKSLKRENERAYAVDRTNQMINGEDRPSGMSAKYNMDKKRAVQYEALIYKIFLAGRMKNHV